MERLLGLVMILSLFVAVVGWDGLIGRSGDESELRCRGLNNAWTMAKTIVRQHLGDPLILSFPNRATLDGLPGKSLQHLGNCRYKIAAFVDAYYDHGNLKRRYFVIELSFHGRNGWRMDQLDFAEHPNSEATHGNREVDSETL